MSDDDVPAFSVCNVSTPQPFGHAEVLAACRLVEAACSVKVLSEIRASQATMSRILAALKSGGADVLEEPETGGGRLYAVRLLVVPYLLPGQLLEVWRGPGDAIEWHLRSI